MGWEVGSCLHICLLINFGKPQVDVKRNRTKSLINLRSSAFISGSISFPASIRGQIHFLWVAGAASAASFALFRGNHSFGLSRLEGGEGVASQTAIARGNPVFSERRATVRAVSRQAGEHPAAGQGVGRGMRHAALQNLSRDVAWARDEWGEARAAAGKLRHEGEEGD